MWKEGKEIGEREKYRGREKKTEDNRSINISAAPDREKTERGRHVMEKSERLRDEGGGRDGWHETARERVIVFRQRERARARERKIVIGHDR